MAISYYIGQCSLEFKNVVGGEIKADNHLRKTSSF